jgi:hypothetical protein
MGARYFATGRVRVMSGFPEASFILTTSHPFPGDVVGAAEFEAFDGGKFHKLGPTPEAGARLLRRLHEVEPAAKIRVDTPNYAFTIEPDGVIRCAKWNTAGLLADPRLAGKSLDERVCNKCGKPATLEYDYGPKFYTCEEHQVQGDFFGAVRDLAPSRCPDGHRILATTGICVDCKQPCEDLVGERVREFGELVQPNAAHQPTLVRLQPPWRNR